MGHLEPVAGSDALAGASASPGCLPPPCPAGLHLEHHQESRAQCGPCTSTARNTMNVCASQQCSPHARKNPITAYLNQLLLEKPGKVTMVSCYSQLTDHSPGGINISSIMY